MNMKGFTLVQEEVVTELASTARLWRHDATGAEVLSFTNKDENKVFGVSLRTPPGDSTGVAHILEHSVLCGSEKYPVKEPFVELLRGSLQTFLNAFTYPDKTCYPVASANLNDFYNLIDVYLDAVFFPNITKAIFQQEGWHFDPQEDGTFQFKGVVYNEMKGAFSSPESVLGRYCLHHLFPNTAYALESGGDPKEIPTLTYENFKDFHSTLYHPSNARFYFWGDDPEEKRLEILAPLLDRFTRLEVTSGIGVQQPNLAPRTVSIPYAASPDDKAMVVVNWLGPDVMHTELGLAFRMIEHILLGMPASPLRRALIESGLGEDLAGQGLEAELRQLAFDAGLKGVSLEDTQAVEALIIKTLEELVEKGISEDMVEAAINSVEFSLRENNTGRFPVGLSVMLRALTTWLHGGNPLEPLRFEGPLAAIKDAVAAKSGYFENLIRDWLIDNPHRVTVVLTPDIHLAKDMETEERGRLEALSLLMEDKERAAVLEDVKHLHEWQKTPDSPEALSSIPRLKVDDLPGENTHIPTKRLDIQYPLTLLHPLETNGIVYVEAAFDLTAVPEYLLPMLPLFGRALVEMGTERHSFVDLNMTIARKTGGMDCDTLFLTNSTTKFPVARLVLSGKAAPDKVEALFSIMGEVLSQSMFDDQEHFLRMVLEEKARQEHSLVPAGHTVVATRLRAALCGAGMLSESTGGISALPYLRQLVDRVENDWSGVLQDLDLLRRLVLHRAGLALNLTATAAQEEQLERQVVKLVDTLPEQSVDGASDWFGKTMQTPEAEALILPAQVNYVGKGINLFDSGYSWHGSASVILKYLRTGYLWEKVRVQGGAYGCMCGLDRMSGAFYMVSYRDPNIQRTLDVYDAAAEHLAKHTVTDEELGAAIVGAIGELDSYMLPDAKGSAAFIRLLCNDTVDLRQQMREEILGTTAGHFHEFGQALESFTGQGRICALGGSALERVAEEKGWHKEQVL